MQYLAGDPNSDPHCELPFHGQEINSEVTELQNRINLLRRHG